MQSRMHSYGTPAPLRLSDGALQEIRGVMQRSGKPDEVRAHLRLFCEAARTQQLSPEQLLVIFKTEFARIPEVSRPSDEKTMKFVAGVVTLCIEEYYKIPE